MRFVRLSLIAAVAVPLAVAVPSLGVAMAEESAPRQKERRICRREPTTGTRLAPPRVCRTQREWDETAQQAREDMDRMQNRSRFRETTLGAGGAGTSRCPLSAPNC